MVKHFVLNYSFLQELQRKRKLADTNVVMMPGAARQMDVSDAVISILMNRHQLG
jgi:hypothetical protein